jgi:molybdate transport system substrate-binding protein
MALQIRSALLLAVAAIMAIAAGSARADEVKVLAANAVKEPFLALAATFEKATGHKVAASWSGTEGIAKRIMGGEVADVVLVGSASIDRLIQEGKVVPGSRASVAKVGVGVAVRAGLPKPDISSADGVRKAVLDAKSVAYSSGPSGQYIAELFKRLGIAEQVSDKLKVPPSNVPVSEVLARGEADLGFQQISELLNVNGIDYLGPLPSELQNMTVYFAGLHSAAPAPDAAKALIKSLTAPESGPIIKRSGMEPG